MAAHGRTGSRAKKKAKKKAESREKRRRRERQKGELKRKEIKVARGVRRMEGKNSGWWVRYYFTVITPKG